MAISVSTELFACRQNRGAAAVIFAAAPGADIDLINCTSPAECSLPLTIPATMITHKAGHSLQVRTAGWLCLGRDWLYHCGTPRLAIASASSRWCCLLNKADSLYHKIETLALSTATHKALSGRG